MERADVIVLEVDFDEGFPVVIAIVDLDPVQHVARKIEVMNAERREILPHVALAVEQEAVPVGKR